MMGAVLHSKPGRKNVSGVVGVIRRKNKWGAKIGDWHIGNYDTIEEAAAARERCLAVYDGPATRRVPDGHD